MTETQTTRLDQLQERLGVRWESIARAREESARLCARLESRLAPYSTEDAAIVVFGSLARGEATSGSDVDWTLLVDGQSFAEHGEATRDIAEWLEQEGLRSPGPEGTFGEIASSHVLINQIGGEGDTNRNLTQRILLLLESEPIGRPDAYARVVRGLLDRYISEDFGWLHSSNPAQVPRFLQNDIARYWRTVAVDFAYKRHARAGKGWALRTAKLRLSRKLTYAAGLAACFECAFLKERHPGFEGLPVSDRAPIVMSEMQTVLRQTPLEIIAGVFLRFYDDLAGYAEHFFGSYDQFLALLDDKQRRDGLDQLRQDEASADETFQHVRALGHRFQDAPNAIFLPESRGVFYDLTRTYGVF